MATGAADQAARRLSAEDLPVRRSATTSNETFCPSLRLCNPARSTALICTENILATVVRLNETKAFLAVKPLYCSLRHGNFFQIRVWVGRAVAQPV